MDEFVGAQRPAQLITDPAEALRALEAVVPNLPAARRPEPAVLDWALIEGNLGTSLPADYKLLAEHYPQFVLGDFLTVRIPDPGQENRFPYNDEAMADEWEEWYGLRPYPAPGGWLHWGASSSGDHFLWTTSGDRPEDWPVTVLSRSACWWHYTSGVVQFLADWVQRTVKLWSLPLLGTEVAIRDESGKYRVVT
ncbi:hypothetical protein ABZ863_23550 [Saccharomonospora sp. NPDC046836]|uniref:hypothetical protein n=1 Tax=Saccharomonospora sp. NPDC046836 TaxID=3156921 RepID=UPI0033D4DBFC